MRQTAVLRDAGSHADRPVGPRRDDPVDPERTHEALDRRCSVERMQRRSANVNPGAPGSRSTTATDSRVHARPRADPDGESAPRTRRRGLPERESLSTTPHRRDTTRRCARGPPRTTCRPASRAAQRPCRPSRCGGRPGRAVPGRCRSARRAFQHVEHHRRDLAHRDVEPGRDVDHLPDLVADRISPTYRLSSALLWKDFPQTSIGCRFFVDRPVVLIRCLRSQSARALGLRRRA